MRIISQNGYDFPYEQVVVIVDEKDVICRPISDMRGRYYLLGHYDTEERAQEIFNSINKSYYNIPLMEDGNTFYNHTSFVMPDK